MIESKTETVELFSRLGKVGSIQAFAFWIKDYIASKGTK